MIESLEKQKSRFIIDANYYEDRHETEKAIKHFKKAMILERELSALLKIQNDHRWDIELLSAGFCAIHARSIFFANLAINELENNSFWNRVQSEVFQELKDACQKLKKMKT